MQYIGGGGSGCTMAEAEAVADKLSGATLPPSGNTLPLRGLKMAVAEAVAAAGDPTGHRTKPPTLDCLEACRFGLYYWIAWRVRMNRAKKLAKAFILTI